MAPIIFKDTNGRIWGMYKEDIMKFEIGKYRKKPVIIEAYQTDKEFDIETLEGTMHADVNDFIITGVHGEQYPCKPDIFMKTYEPVNEVAEMVMDNLKKSLE